MKIYYSEMTFNADVSSTEFVGDATSVYETMELIKADHAQRMERIKAAWENTFECPWPGSLELKNCMIDMVKRGNETLVTTGSDISLYIIRP